jgi:hypothetical protein
MVLITYIQFIISTSAVASKFIKTTNNNEEEFQSLNKRVWLSPLIENGMGSCGIWPWSRCSYSSEFNNLHSYYEPEKSLPNYGKFTYKNHQKKWQ